MTQSTEALDACQHFDCRPRDGYIVCINCGLVLDRAIVNLPPPVHEQNKHLNRSFYGIRTLNPLGSSMNIFNIFKDHKNNYLTPELRGLYQRLKRRSRFQFQDSNDAFLKRGLTSLVKIVREDLKLSEQIIMQSIYYFKKIFKQVKVKNRIVLFAVCLLFAIKNNKGHALVNIKEICEAFNRNGHNVKVPMINKRFFEYKKYIKLDNKAHRAEDYIPRLVSDIFSHIDERLKKKKINLIVGQFRNVIEGKCFELLNELSSFERKGRNPKILAGAIIYLSERLVLNQRLFTYNYIAKCTGLNDCSIRSHFTGLLKPRFLVEESLL